MRNMRVKQLATPLAEYTNVRATASLLEAAEALERAIRGQGEQPSTRPRDFAVMVINEQQQVIGRLVVWDLLQALETGGSSRVDSLSMVEDFGAWSNAANMSAKARHTRVASLVRSLHKEEFIDEEQTLDQALERLVRHRFLSLIVTRQGQAVGVLRVVDVFSRVYASIKKDVDA